MRMGFFMGAVLGAAAAYYVSRNNVKMSELPGKAAGAMISMMTTSNSGAHKQNKSAASSSKEQHADVSQVEQIIAGDPALKREVDEIMKSTGSSYTQ